MHKLEIRRISTVSKVGVNQELIPSKMLTNIWHIELEISSKDSGDPSTVMCCFLFISTCIYQMFLLLREIMEALGVFHFTLVFSISFSCYSRYILNTFIVVYERSTYMELKCKNCEKHELNFVFMTSYLKLFCFISLLETCPCFGSKVDTPFDGQTYSLTL